MLLFSSLVRFHRANNRCYTVEVENVWKNTQGDHPILTRQRILMPHFVAKLGGDTLHCVLGKKKDITCSRVNQGYCSFINTVSFHNIFYLCKSSKFPSKKGQNLFADICVLQNYRKNTKPTSAQRDFNMSWRTNHLRSLKSHKRHHQRSQEIKYEKVGMC